jgi:hypothetical protein
MGVPRRHPLASPAVICAAVGALVVYPTWLAQQRPRQAAPPQAGRAVTIATTSRAAGHATTSEHAAAGDTATAPVRDDPFDPVTPVGMSAADAPQAVTLGPAEAVAAEIQTAVKAAEPGLGRENPFDPLAATGATHASGTARVSGSTVPRPASRRPMLPLPPVPPLDPSNLAPEGAGGTAATNGLRLVGFVTGRTVLAVIEDAGRSYLAAPGDLIRPGLRVAAVDAERQMVRLEWHGTPLVLSVAIPTSP